MEILGGNTLVNKNQESVSADDVLGPADVIAFYFSAHWCPPCRMFTRVLFDFYEEIKEQSLPFEVVFISSDRSEEALFDYMVEAHGDWYAVPYGSPMADQLKGKFGVQGIPTLVIMKKNGTVVTCNGRSDVENKGVNAFRDWNK